MTVPASDTIPRQTALQRWLRINRHVKPIVYAQVYQTADVHNIDYWLEIVFSAGIAALGLALNSPAVIIGAMSISPPMGPIMATGLHVPSTNVSICARQRSPL